MLRSVGWVARVGRAPEQSRSAGLDVRPLTKASPSLLTAVDTLAFRSLPYFLSFSWTRPPPRTMAATYNHHNYQYGQRLYQSQAQQQQSQHRRYPSTPGLGVGLEGYPTRHQHVHDLRAQAASPALSTSSYEHIVFGVGAESDDDVVVYRPHASTSRSVHHVRSPSAPTFSTTSSTLASPSAPTPVSRHAPAPRPAPTFQLRMIPWSDDRSDLESDAGSTDEILFPSWGISLPRPPFREDDTFSEATTEDNVLFSRPRSRANWADDVDAATNGTGVDGIESALANLNMAECSSSRVQSPTPPPSPGRKKKRHHHHHRRVRSDGASTSQAAPSKQSPATPKAKAGKLKPVVPEEDEVPDMPSSEALSAAYEEAARYIT